MNASREILFGFEKVCTIHELTENVGRRFIVNNTEVAIFLIKQKIYAVSNICPHQHSALIFDGFIEDEFVACPAHGWKFNLETGKTPSGAKGLTVFETAVFENDVYIKVGEKKLSW